MNLVLPTYICLDVPEPHASQVLAVRERHCERLRGFPVELTIAGSSGMGAIRAQQDGDEVAALLAKFCRETAPIPAEFGAVVRFPETDIFCLSMADPMPFEALQDGLRATGLRFEDSRFPFFPHCTLRMAGPLDQAAIGELFALRLPGRFMLATMSLYQREPDDTIRKVWSAPFTGPELPTVGGQSSER